jgi:hypothetical protein
MIQLPWRRATLLLVPLAMAAFTPPAGAQVTDSLRLRDQQQARDTTPSDSVRRARARARAAADSVAGGLQRYRISPRTAFIRSLVLPGWGQSSIGAPGRGAVYFALESGSLWMVYKSDQKLQESRRIDRLRREEGTLAEGASSGLTRARRNEREDWITLSVFWLFFSGADAYVSAHLRGFDAHVEVQPAPTGGAQLQVTVPVGN